jgi:hypothetical protein
MFLRQVPGEQHVYGCNAQLVKSQSHPTPQPRKQSGGDHPNRTIIIRANVGACPRTPNPLRVVYGQCLSTRVLYPYLWQRFGATQAPCSGAGWVVWPGSWEIPQSPKPPGEARLARQPRCGRGTNHIAILIGDTESDMQAGLAMGTASLRLGPGGTDTDPVRPFQAARSFRQAVVSATA